ncbi:hypothetical protein ACSQ67_005527 [Phaseolus vulgaris]
MGWKRERVLKRKRKGQAKDLAIRMGKTIELYGFPTSVTAHDVKIFVENYTGKGTIAMMKIRHGKGRIPRAFAIIQFTTEEYAASMMSIANNFLRTLRYGTAFLKARVLEKDIDSKIGMNLPSLEGVKVYFGCPISKEVFSVLEEMQDVSLSFGSGKRKVQLMFSHNLVQYRLELSYENIWKVELIRPRNRTACYLLIQLLGAPRIFENGVQTYSEDVFVSIFDNPLYNFFKDVPEDQWTRTIDFTKDSCIGQSSAICLEFSREQNLPNFKNIFAYYEQSERQYTLQIGTPFSQNWDLVPIVAPQGVEIPYDILFKVNSLVQHACLPGPALNADFYRLVDPGRMPLDFIENALEKLYYSKEFCYEPAKWLTNQYNKYLKSKHHPRSPTISLDAGLVYVRRVQITPCKVYFCGPEVNVSNRVLRHFHEHLDNFIRVSFVDEELDKMFSTDLSSRAQKKTEVYKRILDILKNGILIGDKKFEFLAFSSSQLRENSLWMFAPTGTGCSAAFIREWMGNFSRIRNVAKYAARLGQSFGSSTETLSVRRDEIEIIHDVKRTCGGIEYVFSDGIGKISLEFAKRVAKKCGYDCTPSAFQIRYGGYKGVVAVDPESPYKLSLRNSMRKYDSDNTKLDVLGRSKFQPCFLNRQLITLLSTLGIKDGVFEKKQREAVDQLNTILTDSLKAQEVLDLMSTGEITNVLKEMLICGYKPNEEPFLSMMLQVFRASKLLELRLKSRIFIPKGRAMMGCLDETSTLEYGQVFVQFSNNRLRDLSDDDSCSYDLPKTYMVVGKVVVAKNPCLHPGDVRVLQAVDVPDLYHMVDCVVFPQKGTRPHPNECSGSDLDGDIYFVCWDPELVPSGEVQPMDYTPSSTIELDHDVTIEEVEEYFCNYIVNDSLGIIANAHTVFADNQPGKAMSAQCLQLAKLFSTAVDFPKTGVPAVIPRELYAKEYPDFMEKSDKVTYKSPNVIGKLFREVKEISADDSISSFTQEVARRSYDTEMEVDGFMDYVDDAIYYKTNYDYKLGNLMDYYGIKTEGEILSGNITKMSKSFNKRRDAEAVNVAVRSLRKEARSWFNEGSSDDDAYAKASAWYHVTYHPSFWGSYNDEGMNRDHYLSFPWCVYPQLLQIKKEKMSMRNYSSAYRLSGLHLN